MRKQLLIKLVLAVILLLLLFPFSGSGERPDLPKAYPQPKLVLILIIDQFRYDYLVRFRPQFVERGFNLLLSGANFVNCRYDYATTVTGPGHASLLTGAYPNLHGIIGNSWYDRSLHREVTCVEDLSTKLVGGTEGPGGSPRNLMGSTLGDELRLASDFNSKVIAIALKDRAAILPGGHTANSAYWYDVKTGNFVSSTYYMTAFPSWVTRFNEQSAAKAYCGKAWQALPETLGANAKVLQGLRPVGNEPCPGRKFLEWLGATPFMNEIELNFALEALKNERLGQGSTTDLLSVSLSVNDSIGHAFGPYSPEVADATLRTDRYLAQFLNSLDRIVGLENVWIALSADHGVAPNPEFIEEHHLGRGIAEPTLIQDAVEQALSRAFGPDRWIEDFDGFHIYLNQRTLEKHHVEKAEVEALAAQVAEFVPGVMAAFTRTQILAGKMADLALGRQVSNSFNRQRSGDVFLVLDPYVLPVKRHSETTHGSPWNYDAQVPLLLWGRAFKPGMYPVPCQPIDLAPTLSVALGLSQPSGAQGQPLTSALN